MTLTGSFVLNTSESVSVQIYRFLREAIVRCQMLPGDAISDKTIAQQFGVSRQPVRDALIRLSFAGLVEILPQRGTFVTRISKRRVNSGRFIRESVEVAIARKAALVMDDGALSFLKRNLDAQSEVACQEDTAQFLVLDEAFHNRLSDAIACVEAWEAIEGIKAQMDRVRYLSLDHVTPLPILIAQHTAIYDALQAKNPDAAEAKMREHLSEIYASVGTIEARNVGWFSE